MAQPPTFMELYGNYLILAIFLAIGYFVVYPLFVD